MALTRSTDWPALETYAAAPAASAWRAYWSAGYIEWTTTASAGALGASGIGGAGGGGGGSGDTDTLYKGGDGGGGGSGTGGGCGGSGGDGAWGGAAADDSGPRVSACRMAVSSADGGRSLET